MTDIKDKEIIEDFYDAIIAIDDKALCKEFCADVFTATEIAQLAHRLRAAKLLYEGKTYARIMEETDLSGATLSRVNSCLRRGQGGYAKIIEKTKREKK